MNIFIAGVELISSEIQTVTDVTAENVAVPNIKKALQK